MVHRHRLIERPVVQGCARFGAGVTGSEEDETTGGVQRQGQAEGEVTKSSSEEA